MEHGMQRRGTIYLVFQQSNCKNGNKLEFMDAVITIIIIILRKKQNLKQIYVER
jgi:hypothetical protein